MDIDRYIGRLLDNRYEILEVIGTGGMAVVYKARCHRLNRLVAIKILKDEFIADEEFRRRFRAEGEAVAMLSHPNIVSVYDVSATDDANFIVMELIEGITLKQYMGKKGVLNWKETLHFGIQIAKALEHAHDKGIVHRDIKPHNVMVLKNGSVKVTDFGIARVTSKSNTLTKEALGSVHYISPEQAMGGWVDNRSDLYSLSVVMYEMMAGRPPYDGDSPVAVAIQHINGGAAMPSTLNPNIPGGLEQIIMKGMALDPKNRYASATEMLKDMDEFRTDPAMLFVIPGMPTGATQVLPSKEQLQAEAAKEHKTTAERVAGAASKPQPPASGANRPAPHTPRPRTPNAAAASAEVARRAAAAERARKEQEAREQEKRSRTTTIAIVACSAVAIIAIICVLVALSNGILFQDHPLVTVPTLKGEVYEDLPAYDTFTVEILELQYSDEYLKGVIIEQKIEPGIEVEVGTVIKVIVSAGPEPEEDEPIIMEDLTSNGGVTFDYAKSYLEKMGMKVLPFEETNEEFEAGRVFKTDPEVGAELKEGQTIKVWISTGSATVKAKMIDVVGMQYEDAREALRDQGFTSVTYKPAESDKPEKEVIDQPYAEGTELDVGETIELTISTGPKPTEKPTEKPTDPPAQDTTLIFTFTLPDDRTEDYVLSLRDQDGNEMEGYEDIPIKGGSPEIQIELTGTGVVFYQLYINGEYYKTEKVEFIVNG